MPLRFRHIEINPRQFFSKGAHMEVPFDLAQAGELLAGQWRQKPGRRFHGVRNLKYGRTSGNQRMNLFIAMLFVWSKQEILPGRVSVKSLPELQMIHQKGV